MASQTKYSVNGEVVSTLKEVSALLGKRVTKGNLLAGDYPEVTIIPETLSLQEIADASDNIEIIHIGADDVPPSDPDAGHMSIYDDASDNPGIADTDDANDPDMNPPTDDSPTDDVPGDDQLEYPEVGEFKDVKAMKKYVKKLSDLQLQEWCELEGATWNPSEHEAINRMRMAMAIKAIHFPDTTPKASKKKSKYSDYSTEDLVQMALDNDIEVRDDKGDARILRMYTIMALREAGLLA